MDNSFEKLNRIPVDTHIEKKNGFSYLSWPFAVSQLRLADPAATWEVRRFDALPYLKTETGYFVEVVVTVQGITLSQIHPVLDADNRPIPAPTCFEINTSIQRVRRYAHLSSDHLAEYADRMSGTLKLVKEDEVVEKVATI